MDDMEQVTSGGSGSGGGLKGFDFTADEALAELHRFREDSGRRDGRVCACGHPMTRHQESDLREAGRGIVRSCNPVRMTCPCTDPKPVVTAADTRPFLHKTKGRGPRHALSLALAACEEKGREWDWLEGWPACELGRWPEAECEKERGVAPYPVNLAAKRLTDEPEPTTLMLCRAHALAAAENGLPL